MNSSQKFDPKVGLKYEALENMNISISVCYYAFEKIYKRSFQLPDEIIKISSSLNIEKYSYRN